METDRDSRAIDVANFMIQNQATIRQAASEFHVSATTISHDLRKRLPNLDQDLYQKVSRILRHNIEVRSYRGGNSTRKKYRNKKRNER